MAGDSRGGQGGEAGKGFAGLLVVASLALLGFLAIEIGKEDWA